MAPTVKAFGEAAFADQLNQSIPETTGETIHIVMDNYATHKTPRVQRRLASRPRYKVYFTSTIASWLNRWSGSSQKSHKMEFTEVSAGASSP